MNGWLPFRGLTNISTEKRAESKDIRLIVSKNKMWNLLIYMFLCQAVGMRLPHGLVFPLRVSE